MEEHWLIIIFKNNQHFIWFFAFVEACRFLLRLLPEKQSPLKLKDQILFNKSNKRFKIKKEFHQINKDSFLLVNNWKMEEHWLITISKKNQLFIWFFVFVEACRFLLRLLPEKQSPLKLKDQIPFNKSNKRFKTKKEFHQINKD